jgi:hypothetical protein
MKILSMEEHALKNVNNCLYTNVYSYLETSGDISIRKDCFQVKSNLLTVDNLVFHF